MMECSKHRGNQLIVVCSQCKDQPICTECLVECHNGHATSTFGETVSVVRKHLKEISTKNADILSKLRSHLDKVSEVRTKQNSSTEEFSLQIQERRASLYKLVDTAADQITKEYQAKWQKNNAILKENSDIISKCVESRKQYGSTLDEILKRDSDVKVIQDTFALETVPQEAEFPRPQPIKLNDSADKANKMKNMFGKLTKRTPDGEIKVADESQPVPLSVYSNVILPNDVLVLSPCGRGICYASRAGNDGVLLVDENEICHGTFDLRRLYSFHGFDNDHAGNLYVCCEGPKCLRKICMPEGNVVTLFGTNKLVPYDVRRTRTGEFLVLLLEESFRNSNERTDDSKRILIKYDEGGKILAVAEKDKFDNFLFTMPLRLRMNQTEDTLAVVNRVSNDYAYLVLLDDKLNLKLRYIGENQVVQGNSLFAESDQNENKIKISDAAFDSSNNIWICDVLTSTVQRLSPTCTAMQVLFVSEEVPRSIAVNHNDRIWLGCVGGDIYVLEDKDSANFLGDLYI